MFKPSEIQKPRQIGDVSVVLIQHWASMVDDLRTDRNRAADAAEEAQHRLHQARGHINSLHMQLTAASRDFTVQNNLCVDLITYVQNLLEYIPGMHPGHILHEEYLRIINEYNMQNQIDLTETDESGDELE